MKIYSFLIFSISLLTSCNNINHTQSKETVIEREETSILMDHLFFLKGDFRKTTFTELEITDEFILNQEEYLTLHFSLDKPLVESLQELAPDLKTDQLLEKGNFQFSFLVDNEVVYVQNLNKGAGLPASKTTQLEHFIPLVYPEQIDYWGWFMWFKFMKIGGGVDALNEGTHTLQIEVRPYLKQKGLKVGATLAKGTIEIEIPKKIIDKSLIPIQEIKPNSGWELSDDSFDRSKIEALNEKIAQNRFENINGIVVIKDGKLLLEEYFNGETRDSLHDPRSVGKSFASTIMGIAIEDNYISSEEALLKEFYDLEAFKNYSSKKDSITLKSLLTMSSCFVGDDMDMSNPGNEENMYPTKDWVKFALDLPMEENKRIGEDYSYFTAGAVVLGDVLHQSVPEGLVAYADKKLFAPLNITNYKWQFTPQNVGNTAGGIQLRALDFAKYGQLYKNKGVWNGERILTEKWVEKSLEKQVERNAGDGFYGYLFWNKVFEVNNTKYEVSYSTGRGGNKIFIFKDIPYVIVVTASAYNSPAAHQNVNEIMTDYILPSILQKK